MYENENSYVRGQLAAHASISERAAFIRNTYLHVAIAVLAFVMIEGFIFISGMAETMVRSMIAGGRFGWLLILGLYMLVSHVANKWAQSDTSKGIQYVGLGVYVTAEAFLFCPLIAYALIIKAQGGPDILKQAAIITGALFVGLTIAGLTSKNGFSWLGGILSIGFMVSFGVILASLIFGFTLGVVFTGIMVSLAAGMILYTTSNLVHEYRTDQYVAASLTVFASLALLFWYILRLLSILNRD